jgi:hypothetical protein
VTVSDERFIGGGKHFSGPEPGVEYRGADDYYDVPGKPGDKFVGADDFPDIPLEAPRGRARNRPGGATRALQEVDDARRLQPRAVERATRRLSPLRKARCGADVA